MKIASSAGTKGKAEIKKRKRQKAEPCSIEVVGMKIDREKKKERTKGRKERRAIRKDGKEGRKGHKEGWKIKKEKNIVSIEKREGREEPLG